MMTRATTHQTRSSTPITSKLRDTMRRILVNVGCTDGCRLTTQAHRLAANHPKATHERRPQNRDAPASSVQRLVRRHGRKAHWICGCRADQASNRFRTAEATSRNGSGCVESLVATAGVPQRTSANAKCAATEKCAAPAGSRRIHALASSNEVARANSDAKARASLGEKMWS